jgi:hypothetical protein
LWAKLTRLRYFWVVKQPRRGNIRDKVLCVPLLEAPSTSGAGRGQSSQDAEPGGWFLLQAQAQQNRSRAMATTREIKRQQKARKTLQEIAEGEGGQDGRYQHLLSFLLIPPLHGAASLP